MLVSKPPKPRSPGPPHNSGVRELVAGKRRWASPLKRADAIAGFQGWHERGYLPHRDEPGLTQLVTFHVADSFPAELRSEWAALLEIEDDKTRRKKLEAYVDKGRGKCLLRKPEIARLVDRVLRFHHGTKYELRAWVVMPNHLHVLFKVGSTPMRKVVSDWKEYSAREANKILGRRGRFWADDFWDTYMRDSAHELSARCYTENNPVKALLVRESKDWPWSSARFRDAYGRLCLEPGASHG
jgi:putative transposase